MGLGYGPGVGVWGLWFWVEEHGLRSTHVPDNPMPRLRMLYQRPRGGNRGYSVCVSLRLMRAPLQYDALQRWLILPTIYTRTHARTHARARAHTLSRSLSLCFACTLSLALAYSLSTPFPVFLTHGVWHDVENVTSQHAKEACQRHQYNEGGGAKRGWA